MTSGWTFDQFDAAPFPQVLKQMEYWAKHPPTHELVAAFFDYKAPKSKNEISEVEKRMAMLPALPNSSLPAYVREAMKKHREERASAV